MPDRSITPRWPVWLLVLGLYLTLRGYHSRDGDQAYRLPLLLHRQDPALFADDPFVRAFDAFNPHRGYLILLDVASRPLGLSAGLAALFALTFAVTAVSIDRLARAAWPEAGTRVGVVAVGLVLIAKAGNIGTNHLFEATLLDRLIGFALGWLALALVIERPERGWWSAPLALGLAALIHPAVGLQWALVLGTAWVAWGVRASRTGVDGRLAAKALGALGLAMIPGAALNLGQGGRLLEGLPVEEFRLLSVELQGPQHMLPHLWRLPQWLAWGCYPVLSVLALGRMGMRAPGTSAEWPAARVRLAIVLAILLAGLGAAWVAVEVVGDLRVTLFQPFRMATVARGVALVALSGRVLTLWQRESFLDRARAAVLAVGLAGDWAMVVATAFEVAATVGQAVVAAMGRRGWGGRVVLSSAWIVLGAGLVFLARHDTESGHLPLLAALAVGAIATWLGPRRAGSFSWTPRRLAWATAGAWALPLGALVASLAPWPGAGWSGGLISRCRFTAIPADDIERLAVWCRDHTPTSARFIGPPGPKTFRLWSLRSLAFNRAGSPYHAAGLADWSARFRAHVGFSGPTPAFVRAYLNDRHGLEQRYQGMSDAERAALAIRQGATHVVAAAPGARESKEESPLELLHVEGRYAVYRVREIAIQEGIVSRSFGDRGNE